MIPTVNAFDIIISLVVTLVSLFLYMLKTANDELKVRILALEIKDEKYLRKDFYEAQRKEDMDRLGKFEKEVKDELRNLTKEVNNLPRTILDLLEKKNKN